MNKSRSHIAISFCCILVIIGIDFSFVLSGRSAYAETLPVSDPGRWPSEVEVDITIDPTTVNGSPWHGMSGALVLHNIPLMPNLPTYAPSPIMCVVTARSGPYCYGRTTDGVTHSACVQSFDCEWPDVRVPDETFAMVFITEGRIVGNKFVDVAIFSQRRLRENDPERRNIDDIARAAAAALAPTASPMEIERRERPFQSFLLEDCENGCRLRQSKIGVILDR